MRQKTPHPKELKAKAHKLFGNKAPLQNSSSQPEDDSNVAPSGEHEENGHPNGNGEQNGNHELPLDGENNHRADEYGDEHNDESEEVSDCFQLHCVLSLASSVLSK